MGLLDTINAAKEQIKARQVAEGRMPASEMYADVKEKQRSEREEREKRERETRARERKEKADADAETEREQKHTQSQELKHKRHEQFRAERAQQRAVSEKQTKEKKFQTEQEIWNLSKKYQYKDEQYKAEQEKIVKSKQVPTVGQSIGRGLGNIMYDLTKPAPKPKQQKQRHSSSVLGGPVVSRQPTQILGYFTPSKRQPAIGVKRKRKRQPRDLYSIDLDYIL